MAQLWYRGPLFTISKESGMRMREPCIGSCVPTTAQHLFNGSCRSKASSNASRSRSDRPLPIKLRYDSRARAGVAICCGRYVYGK